MKVNPLITVFTPTYNRAYTLTRLYNSLLIQTNKDFEWLIVDDGSTDNTENLVDSFIKEKKISISYYKQKNSGKYIAVNYGLDLAKGDYFYIVDSDDFLTNSSIQDICVQLKQIQGRTNFAGISGVMVHSNMKTIGKEMPTDIVETDLITFRYKLKFRSDRAEIFSTHIFRKFKFPVFEYTKFCPEGVPFYRIANVGYLLHFFNKPITIVEYLPDGLSFNHYARNKDSIKSIMLCYEELFSYKINLYNKIRTAVNYWRYSFFSERNFAQNLKAMNYWGVILYPLGLFAMIYSEIKYK
jgi:glycosyltransferase involved in cell wall biosynthesis